MRYRAGLRTREGVIVEWTDGEPTILEPSGSERVISRRCEMASDWEFLAKIASPVMRFDSLAESEPWSQHLPGWLADHREELLATIGDRRRYAWSALGAGELDLLNKSHLTDCEASWLEMHGRHRAGDPGGAARAALRLAPTSYPDHALVLLAAASSSSALTHTPEFERHVAELPATFPGARLLAAMIEGASARQVHRAVDEAQSILGDDLAGDLEKVIDGKNVAYESLWVRAATHAPITAGDLEVVYQSHPSYADDLIDAALVGAGQLPGDLDPYLAARLRIDEVSVDQLEALGGHHELARRAFVTHDDDALVKLRGVEQSAETLFALSVLRRGEVPDELPDHPVAHAVAASLRSGRAHPNALADASTWTVLTDLITSDDVAAFPDHGSIWQLGAALREVGQWDFLGALERAKAVLRTASDESIRDEALNIVGFSLYQQGQDEQAIAALEKALEGEYSANLQANIGIVARDLQPDVAAHHLVRLADEAPTLDLTLAAVRHAFSIWTTSSDAWDEEGIVMPPQLVATFRRLVVADIPYEDYVHVLQLLSSVDAKWLAQLPNTGQGPHVQSSARKVYVGKASHNPQDYVDALVEVSKSQTGEEWFASERDGFVDSLRSLIFSDGDSLGPAAYAFAAIESGLDLDDFDYVTLASGAALNILASIHADDGLPSDAVVSIIRTSRSRFDRLPDEERDRVESLVHAVGDRYAIVVISFFGGIHDEIIKAVTMIGRRLQGVPRRQINWVVVTQSVQPMRHQARDSAVQVKSVKAFVHDPKLNEAVNDLAESFEAMARSLSNPQGIF